jgi:hypothetical protein
MPSDEDRPAKQCPPPRGTTGVPVDRAYSTVRTMSATDPHRTTS